MSLVRARRACMGRGKWPSSLTCGPPQLSSSSSFCFLPHVHSLHLLLTTAASPCRWEGQRGPVRVGGKQSVSVCDSNACRAMRAQATTYISALAAIVAALNLPSHVLFILSMSRRLQKLPAATLTAFKGRFQIFQCHSEMLQYLVPIFSHSSHSILQPVPPSAWIPHCTALHCTAMLMFSTQTFIYLWRIATNKSSPAANCVSIFGSAWLPLLGGCNADAGYAGGEATALPVSVPVLRMSGVKT